MTALERAILTQIPTVVVRKRNDLRCKFQPSRSVAQYHRHQVFCSVVSRQDRIVKVKAVIAEFSEKKSLPPKLDEIVQLFSEVSDQRTKYEQLLYYAKKLKPLAEEFKSKENKVEGCVSQVWVRAYLGDDSKIYFEAESDSLLTKGLAALLVEGLSGLSGREIVELSPDFIHMFGLKQSLTPSRSNGFFNMFKLMQKKAMQVCIDGNKVPAAAEGEEVTTPPDAAAPTTATTAGKEAAVTAGEEAEAEAAAAAGKGAAVTAAEEAAAAAESAALKRVVVGGERKVRIEKKLKEALNPMLLEVEDVSYQHAGHAAMREAGRGDGGETHFNVKLVSQEFQGKSLVKRHRLVYNLLEDELNNGLHALSIIAKTPSEFQR